MLKLPEELRSVCAEPQGKLYEGKGVEVIEKIEELRECGILTCVGDIVAYYFLKSGIKPHILVMDRRTVRRPLEKNIVDEIDSLSMDYEEMTVKNPPGYLTIELVKTLLKAVEIAKDGVKAKIIVDGEEDLAVMPLVRFLPYNSLIVYGQPGRGMVALKVTDDKKILILELLERMERVNDNGEEVLRICREVNGWR